VRCNDYLAPISLNVRFRTTIVAIILAQTAARNHEGVSRVISTVIARSGVENQAAASWKAGWTSQCL